jgi:predicted lipase
MITGHSLGGALATFAAMEIKRQVSIAASKITFYTFGSPRTGNQAFTNYIFGLYPNGGNQRVTHYNDVVPHLPPTTFSFNHIGDEIWYLNPGADLTYRTCKNVAGK